MTLKKIIRKLKLKFYDANQNIPKIIGQYNLIGSFLVLAVIILIATVSALSNLVLKPSPPKA